MVRPDPGPDTMTPLKRMDTGSLYSELRGKITRVRRREHGIALQAGLMHALAAIITLWMVAITIEMLGEFGVAGRTGIYWGAVLASGVFAAWLAAVPLGRYFGFLPGEDDDAVARRVGRRIPEVGDRLVNTLQLYRSVSSGALTAGYSSELAEASIAVEGEPLRHYDYSVIIEEDRRRRGLLFFLLAAGLITALFLAFPYPYRGAFYRLTHYTQDFIKPAPFSLEIAPGNVKLIRGDSVRIVVRAEGIPPRSVKLVTRDEGRSDVEEYELRGDSAGVFSYTVSAVKETMDYYAVSGPVRSAGYRIAVVERPEVRRMQVTVTPPGYTGRGTERLPENMGDVSGLRGTAIGLQIVTNVQAPQAWIVQLFPRGGDELASLAGGAVPAKRFDTTRSPISASGTNLTGSFRLTRNGEYYVEIRSRDGLMNQSPIHYTISASADASPTIELVEPSGKAEIDQTMLLPTQVHISDDYGFSRLRIMYRLSASKYGQPWDAFRPVDIPIPHGPVSGLDVPYIWNLAKLSMVPEDEVEFYFEVYDNDVVSGPKMARTGTMTLRFPSLEEVLKKAEDTQTQASTDMNKVLQQAQEAKRQMDDLNRELMKQLAQNKQDAAWQQKQKLQELMQQQEQMQKKLGEVADNLQQMSEKLQEAKAISPETLQKYAELQKLFQEMKSPEMMKAMQKLQEAMQKMSPEQMAEAMKNYKFNEEQFRQSIDRTMKILKRMQTEQKVDEMIRRADDLARQQQNLNQQTQSTNPQDKGMRDQLAEHQKDLAKDAQRMQQESQELSKQMSELGEDMPNKEMQDAQQSLQQDSPQEHMDQAGEQMEQGQMEQAQQQGEKAQQSAEHFKQQMQGVKKKMAENNKREVTNKMRKALQNLLDLSKKEEALKEQTDQTQANSQKFRDQAQQQSQMQENLNNVADQLGNLSQKSFSITPEMGRELGDAMRKMQGATQSLESRDGNGASQQEGGAMGALNRAAMMMQQALSQMEGQGQGGGMGMGMQSFQQRLQQIAGDQQMINMAMGQQQGEGQQGEGKDGKSGKNGKNGQGDGNGEGEGGERMKRLSKAQGEVKKSVDELNKEAREAGGTRKNTVGDLERASKEIEEVLTDMQSGQVTPETLQRQERILSRLLDAMKSQRERDFDKERESRSGVDVVRNSPPSLDSGADRNRPELRDQLRSREQGYTKDYEYMIRKYFEALGTAAR